MFADLRGLSEISHDRVGHPNLIDLEKKIIFGNSKFLLELFNVIESTQN